MNDSVAVTVGHFDGVHRGHCRLVEAAREAVGDDGRVIVLSFDPSPDSVLDPKAAQGRLTHFKQRSEWLIRAGADDVLPLQPSRETLSESAESFLERLVDKFGVHVIVEGPDFRFGRKRQGNVAMLRDYEANFGYRTVVIDPVEACLVDQSVVRVSSSLIRWLLLQGRVGDANCLMGRPYELVGDVVKGDQRGRNIGFPTANLDCGTQLLPADGVYAGLAHHPDGQSYVAAISVGTKPTFQNSDPNPVCEAFLLDYDGPVDDYLWSMRLELHCWLRDQMAFNGVDPLLDQLQRDVTTTRNVMADNVSEWRSMVNFNDS